MISDRKGADRATVARLQWLGLGAILLALLLLAAPLVLRLLVTPPQPRAATTEPWPTVPATFAATAPQVLDQPVVAQVQPPPQALPMPEWRSLNHLTTIELTTSSIVMQERTADFEPLLRSVPWVGDTFLPTLGKDVVTDHLVLKAVGKVQLGVDLAQVADVQINGSTIRFRLPQPKVMTVQLLPEQSQIFQRQQVWFLSQATGLETTALEQARLQLQAEVTANQELFTLAAQMARLQLSAFLRKAGFTTVEITFSG